MLDILKIGGYCDGEYQ